jgi:hypothetical protein
MTCVDYLKRLFNYLFMSIILFVFPPITVTVLESVFVKYILFVSELIATFIGMSFLPVHKLIYNLRIESWKKRK